MMVARQCTAWNVLERGVPSRRDGVIFILGCIHYLRFSDVADRLNHTVPLGRVAFFTHPGSKLPGYDHLVPTGQYCFANSRLSKLGTACPIETQVRRVEDAATILNPRTVYA